MPSDGNARSWYRAIPALVIAALVASSQATAQTCQDQTAVIGMSSIADGSTAPGNGMFYPVLDGGGSCSGCEEYAPLQGQVTMRHVWQGPGTYSFSGEHSDYFRESNVGDATCWWGSEVPTPCRHCAGFFSFQFYSNQGAIEGNAYFLPSLRPVTNTIVHAIRHSDWWLTGTVNTDGQGRFKWQDPGPNNWSLNVFRTGTSGPGSETYSVWLYGEPPERRVPVTISSNQMKEVVIYRPENLEEPPRCPTDEEPWPTPAFSPPVSAGSRVAAPMPPGTAGGRVNVTTGNVAFDQDDAAAPGLGLGLRFRRSYNSSGVFPGQSGVLGPGWNHSYEKRLTFPATAVILLRGGDGQPSYFHDSDGDNQFHPSVPFSNESWIEKQGAGYIRRFRRGGSERYEGTGTARLISLTDASGNVTSLGYSGNQLVTITDPGGRQLQLTYTGLQLHQLSGPDGLIATYTYTTAGSLGSALHTVTYADGDGDGQPDGAYTFTYGANGRLWTVADGTGRVLETNLYDGNGRAGEITVSGLVEKRTFTYTQASHTQPSKTIVTDALNNVTTYEWRESWGRRRVTKITGPCSGCGGSGGAVQEWAYDDRGRVTSYKDGEGNVTGYTYAGDPDDGDPNVAQVVAPAPAPNVPPPVTSYTYYTDGRMQARITPNGNTVAWGYGPAGAELIADNLYSGNPRYTYISYTAQGKPEVVTNPLNHSTEMHYTPVGDLEWAQDPIATHRTTFEYDAMGRLEKANLPATTPPNDSARTSYDALGRPWRVTNPNGSYWRHWYDGGGRRVLTQDPNDEQTTFQYDAYGRLWKVMDATGGEVEYLYDSMSNLRFLHDARDKATSFEYDGHNRVKKVTYPSPTKPAPFEEFTYDLAGRLKTRKDRKGVTATFSYDGQGRVTGKTYSDGSAAVSFGYDANGDVGLMTSASNSADTLSWDYDLNGRLLSEGSTRNGTLVGYVYDNAGRRTKLRLNGADVMAYAYNVDDQLDTMTYAAGGIFDFDTDEAHRRQRFVFPNGTTSEYGYDLPSRLSLVRLKRGAAVLNETLYDSNDLNSRSARTENGTRLQFGYDEVQRLLTVDRTIPGPTVRQEEYTYDPAGNRLTAFGIPGSWSYGDRNELQGYSGVTFGYDLNGSQTSRSPARTYVWDAENRLRTVRDNGADVATFEYDPLGRRVAKTTSAGLTRFAYDFEDVLVENGPAGNFTYLHGPGIDEPLARASTGGGALTRFYHLDGLGSVVKRTDGSGNVESSWTYDAFGQAAVAPPNGYGFTSREWDAETGLYYSRARYYDPRIGRFLSEDPARFADGLNRFAYVKNRPTSLLDPWGLWSFTAEIYYLAGLSITLGNDIGGLRPSFVQVGLGVGIGGGYELDLFGRAPGPANCDKFWVSGLNGQVEGNVLGGELNPVNTGWGGVFSWGDPQRSFMGRSGFAWNTFGGNQPKAVLANNWGLGLGMLFDFVQVGIGIGNDHCGCLE